jgi:hypothetical protein
MARVGKIARLPAEVREELNKRLRGGQLGPQILPWLNSHPEVLPVLQEFFGGQPVNAQNLSDWRAGGFAEWQQKQEGHHERLDRIRELSQMSMQLASANGGNLSEGAAAILGGRILEVLELLSDTQAASVDPEAGSGDRLSAMSDAIGDLTLAVARLRAGDHNRETLRQNEERIRQKEQELALAREQFDQKLREYQDKVAEQKRAIEGALVTAKAGGLTPETLQKIEEAAKLL